MQDSMLELTFELSPVKSADKTEIWNYWGRAWMPEDYQLDV